MLVRAMTKISTYFLLHVCMLFVIFYCCKAVVVNTFAIPVVTAGGDSMQISTRIWRRGRNNFVWIRERCTLLSVTPDVGRGRADLASRLSGTTKESNLSSGAGFTCWQLLSTPASLHRLHTLHAIHPFFSKTWRAPVVNSSRRRVSLQGGDWGKRESGAAGGRAEELTRREEEVLAALSGVSEPCTGKEVVQLGLVQDLSIGATREEDGAVTLTLRVPTLALPGRNELAAACEDAVLALPWVTSVAASTKARRPRRQQQRSATSGIGGRGGGLGAVEGGASSAVSPGLESVRDVVCVSSCKGGVGKSTVAVNLAYSLAARGALVGLLDADVYGPSLPTLVNPIDVTLRVSPAFPDLKLLTPVYHRGVACMSFGWVNAKAGVPGAGGRGAAVMRGPMVSKVITQLLQGTAWGELEYLIIDMPPGTGDIQITLCQALQMNGAVVVTTPQKLSYVDVVKGVEMFAALRVPVFSVVENMAYFDCSNGERHRPFGPGHADQLVEECGIGCENVFSLPLSPAVAAGSDGGEPVALTDPGGEEAQVYFSLADAVVREAYRAGEVTTDAPQVSFKPERGLVLRYISDQEAAEYVIPPFQLRTRDPATGEPLSAEQTAAVREDVKPVAVSTRGNYAVSISWSDGHRGGIYSYDVLRRVAEALRPERGQGGTARSASE